MALNKKKHHSIFQVGKSSKPNLHDFWVQPVTNNSPESTSGDSNIHYIYKWVICGYNPYKPLFLQNCMGPFL